jgi:hypothetical protein
MPRPLEYEDYADRLLSGARSRAKRSNVRCTLGSDELKVIWTRAKGSCEVSGLAFSAEEFPDALVKHPFAPSLDRIIPGRDYSSDNVRLVCVCANFSMNEWGLDTLVRLADAVVDHHRQDTVCNRLVALWRARLEGRIEEAIEAVDRMTLDEAKNYRRRIAGLRSALTKSPEGLRKAAAKARATSAGGQLPP